jgi:hypothetical protein
MQHAMSRTLLVATSSAGLVLGGALSAGASQRDGGHYGNHHGRTWAKGWLTVCQTVQDDHRYPPRDGKRDYKDGGYSKDHSNGYDDPNSKLDNRYRYGDDSRDRNRNSYEGRYLVRDSRGQGYWVTLKGRQDCETLRVNKGWAKVSVVHRPDNTRLKSASSTWVNVRKNDRATVSFRYVATWDHSRYDSHRS